MANEALTQPTVSGEADKPRIRPREGKYWVADSLTNFATRTGVGAGNINSGATYRPYFVSRNRLQVEYAYRSSWVVGTIIDCVAEDECRDGVEILCDASPEEIAQVDAEIDALQVWHNLCDTEKWSRLYGGALGLIMIDGQDTSTPLNLETISKGQFRGVLPLDRWAVFPSMSQQDLITDFGPEIGNPKYYDVRPDMGTGLPDMRLHYSRVIRLEGVRLPYWQRITENYWGQSVIERLWDRLIAFDSATNGVAQLVYKAHLRTYKVKDLRKIIATGGKALDGLLAQINMIRQWQSNEGMTLMDTEDEFEAHQYAFTGLDEVLLQFGQQLSGASQIPLVRLFGQSPAGLNSTGESDLRTYYDGIKRQQTARFGAGVRKVYEATWRSVHGAAPPDNWKVQFKPLWQMDDEQRANVATQLTSAIMEPFEKGITARSTTLKELKQAGKTLGLWTNLTDEMIQQAVSEDNEKPPSPEELAIASGKVGPDGKPFGGTNGANGGGDEGNGEDSLSSFSLDARWDESKHKRDKNGEFSSTGEGGGSSATSEVKKNSLLRKRHG